jgi:hypothetical protein
MCLEEPAASVHRPTASAAAASALAQPPDPRLPTQPPPPPPKGFDPNYAGCSAAAGAATLTAAAPLGISGLRPTASLSLNGIYRWGPWRERREAGAPWKSA